MNSSWFVTVSNFIHWPNLGIFSNGNTPKISKNLKGLIISIGDGKRTGA
jgi:hypothetical protein